MADTKISLMPTLGQTEVSPTTDVVPVVVIGPPNVNKKATPQALVSASVGNLTQTWNNAGVVFTALKMNVTDTASAAGSLLMDLQVGGVSLFSVSKNGPTNVAGSISSIFGNVSTASVTGQFVLNGDIFLARDAANTLAQRNGVNPQAFRLYNTYTDASNYERQELTFQSNVTRWFSTAAGTGTIRNMEILRGSTQHWLFNSAGNNFGAHLLASTDNTYDIGASGANRPRSLFVGADVRLGNSGTLYWGTTGSQIYGGTNGVLQLSNAAGNDFSRLQFGGTTNAFPALKRSGAQLHSRLADDSAFANFTAGGTFSLNGDTFLVRPTANTIEQRNSTSPQTFRLYNTYTDDANYERINLNWDTNVAYLLTGAAGTGTQRNFVIGTQGATSLRFATNNVVRWDINSAGHFLAATDNTYDIGASGANRPKDIYIGGSFYRVAGSYSATVDNSGFSATSPSGVQTALRLTQTAWTDFNLVLPASTSNAAMTGLTGALELRNGTNAQTFRVYNTFTDASNYERGVFDWSTTSNALTIGTQNLGTGSQRDVRIVASSNIVLNPTNGAVSFGTGALLINTSRYRISTPGDSIITLFNGAGTDFGRLQFGGTTSSFPSLKRNGTAINVRLADDSADAPLTAGSITSGGVAVPTISSTDTLSNKTLSSPTLSGTVSGGATFTGAITFQQSTNTLVYANGGNGYGAFFPRGSGTNSAYMFFGNITNDERSRITVDNSRNFVISNDGGTTNHLLVGPTGTTSLNGSGVPLVVNSTNSNALKIAMRDAGSDRGYLGADATYSTYLANASGTILSRWTHLSGLMEHLFDMTVSGDVRINGGQLYFGGTSAYLNYSATDQLDIVTVGSTRLRVDAAGLVTANNGLTVLGSGVLVGAPTGGNKGVGTINCTAAYDDNVLLTDLVLDYAVTGTFDAVKYASHPLKDQVAPWWFDPDQYAEFWRTERRLPGMITWTDPADKPSTGESITRLTAVVEMQAALIENLNKRLKELEK